jgi:hypothetical protein
MILARRGSRPQKGRKTMTEVLITPPKSNGGLKGEVSPRALALALSLPPDERAKLAANVYAEKVPIKHSRQQVAEIFGVSVHRLDQARNGSKARRPKPSPQTLDDLGYLMRHAESVVNSAGWWNDSYRERELATLSWAFSEWGGKHPDFQEWEALGKWPATLAMAVKALGAIVATIVAINHVDHQ